MAADQEVIREFLVSLGFKIDEAGGKKFKKSLDESTTSALAVGGALVGAMWAVEQFVESMTEGLSKLYYASQRNNATVAGIKETQAAYESIGLSADDANKAIEKVGSAMRKPWARAALGGLLKVDVSEGRKAEDVEHDIENRLAGMWKAGGVMRQMAENFAETYLGLNEQSMATLAMNIDTVNKFRTDVTDRYKEAGLGEGQMDENAKASAEFQRELALIAQDFTILGNKILPMILPAFDAFAHRFEEWMQWLNKANVEMPKQNSLWGQFVQALTGKAVTETAEGGPTGYEGLNETERQERSADEALFDAQRKQRKNRQRALEAAPMNIESLIDAAAEAHGLDPARFRAQLQHESSLNPNAVNGSHVGIAQFAPGTAEQRHFEAGKDAAQDILQAAFLLKEIMDKHGLSQRGAEQWFNQGTSRGPQGAASRLEADKYNRAIDAIVDNRVRMGGSLSGVSSGGASSGGKSITIAPVTTINVSGAGDANETATTVGRVVRDENSQLVRNSVGAQVQ